MQKEKKIVYFDMDNVLVDFQSGLDKADPKEKEEHKGDEDEIPGIFSLMTPKEGAIEAVNILKQHFNVYILSTAPWKNKSAWSDKLEWVKKYFGGEEGDVFYKRLIISHNKQLNIGDYLIDDRDQNGADQFTGELIRFGSDKFKDWNSVVEYLLEKEGITR